MDERRDLWLVTNRASGSCTDESVGELTAALREAGLNPARTIVFPTEPLPTGAALDAAGIDMVAIFTGDGTINAAVPELCGWQGDVLVLPGGTKNLLAKELHGAEATAAEIVAKVGEGRYRKVHPPVVRSVHGDALAGILAGPGTAWGEVREALREANLPAIARHTAEALGETAAGPMIECCDPPVGRKGGYPLINLTPTEQGIEVGGYYAETIADYARQGLALLRFDFRQGPHDDLGRHRRISLRSTVGAEIGLLIDGEAAQSASLEHFEFARCGTELMATRDA